MKLSSDTANNQIDISLVGLGSFPDYSELKRLMMEIDKAILHKGKTLYELTEEFPYLMAIRSLGEVMIDYKKKSPNKDFVLKPNQS